MLVLLWAAAGASAQTMAVLQGRVFDASDAVLAGATVSVHDESTGFSLSTRTVPRGVTTWPASPPAATRSAVDAPGFRTEVIQELIVDVGRTVVRDFRLTIGPQTKQSSSAAEVSLVDRASATVGHVVTAQTVQQIPLNGRHFTDLGLLVPGSVAPSQNGFSSRPTRGIGAVAINTAGNREEAVAFVVNGVTTNNLTFGSLIFEPPVVSIQEFRVDNSAFGPEHGHVSGAIVNIVTRSGTDAFHGEAFEYARNDAFDARNFFEFTTPDPHPFSKHQFGGSLGGPIARGRTFFFAAFERFRQRQGVDMNSLVLSDEQRAAATDPVDSAADSVDSRARTSSMRMGRRDSSVRRRRSSIRTAGRSTVRHNAGRNDRVHAFYGAQRLERDRARLAGQQHSRVRAHPPADPQHADHQRSAHLRSQVS